MNAQDNKQFVMDGYREFERGDLPQMLERFHDDAHWVGPQADTIPFCSCFRGKTEVEQFFAELAASVQPVRFVTTAFIAEGDKVVVTGEATWQVRSTGLSYDSPWVNVFTLRDGKIARTDAYYDTAPAERAFHPAQTSQAAAQELRH